jgi:hypothetical protein
VLAIASLIPVRQSSAPRSEKFWQRWLLLTSLAEAEKARRWAALKVRAANMMSFVRWDGGEELGICVYGLEREKGWLGRNRRESCWEIGTDRTMILLLAA